MRHTVCTYRAIPVKVQARRPLFRVHMQDSAHNILLFLPAMLLSHIFQKKYGNGLFSLPPASIHRVLTFSIVPDWSHCTSPAIFLLAPLQLFAVLFSTLPFLPCGNQEWYHLNLIKLLLSCHFLLCLHIKTHYFLNHNRPFSKNHLFCDFKRNVIY